MLDAVEYHTQNKSLKEYGLRNENPFCFVYYLIGWLVEILKRLVLKKKIVVWDAWKCCEFVECSIVKRVFGRFCGMYTFETEIICVTKHGQHKALLFDLMIFVNLNKRIKHLIFRTIARERSLTHKHSCTQT